MEKDPRRWVGALAVSNDRLLELVRELDDEALGRQSMASEWTVAQVLSHLGSSAEISQATLEIASGAHIPLGEGGGLAREHHVPGSMATASSTPIASCRALR